MTKFIGLIGVTMILCACGSTDAPAQPNGPAPVTHDPNDESEAPPPSAGDDDPGTPAQIAACANGVAVERRAMPPNVTEQEWRMGVVAGGPRRQAYWFPSSADPNACACAGCPVSRCMMLSSAPGQVACH